MSSFLVSFITATGQEQTASPDFKDAKNKWEEYATDQLARREGHARVGAPTTSSASRPDPPSSPSVALFKDGELVHMVERHHIEGRTAAALATNLTAAFEEYCA